MEVVSLNERKRENEIIKSQRVAAVQTNKQISEMRLFWRVEEKFAKLTKRRELLLSTQLEDERKKKKLFYQFPFPYSNIVFT